MASPTRSSSPVPSLPPPRPKSPPQYPDLYGKRRELLKVQMLEREIGFLEEELKSLEGLQPASRRCKEVHDFLMANPDPLIPTNRKIRRSHRFWKWLCGKSCFNFSWICCCFSGCSLRLSMPSCCNCCPSMKCWFCRWPRCHWPRCSWPSCTWPSCTWPSCTWPSCTWPRCACLRCTCPHCTCIHCHCPHCHLPTCCCCYFCCCLEKPSCGQCCTLPSLSCPDCDPCSGCTCSCPKCTKVCHCSNCTKTCCSPCYLC
ncbi:PREDICTED: guanine nucleotide-binding protein subunit gamma 3 [Nelumbo nucifera]|uniref:Guanine nucleotide-binding protein subunit gamma 3 n=2 Tax=Nelumbo nucifera TaxID=4432 RepID=A0A1U8AHA9_NELNU|nr:PREDICTED: guanine nucleotide-binding protein subunit gamma 3 [Nelumbo nucifera]